MNKAVSIFTRIVESNIFFNNSYCLSRIWGEFVSVFVPGAYVTPISMGYTSTEVEKLDLLTILTCVLKDKYKYAQKRNVEGIFYL
jgi:hypothetical protein